MDDRKTNMLSMGVCTTRHWQMSGGPVQEFNVCTQTITTKALCEHGRLTHFLSLHQVSENICRVLQSETL